MLKSEDLLDNELLSQLEKAIEQLTTSGKSYLDPNHLATVKSICRQADGYVEKAHHIVMLQLEKNHAEIRFSAFQIIDEIFMRCHSFRELVLNSFKDLIELVVEVNLPGDKQILQPMSKARDLVKLALSRILYWHSQFASRYPKLGPGLNYLRHSARRMEFAEIEKDMVLEEERRILQAKRMEQERQQKLALVKLEIDDLIKDIEDCLTTFDTCFCLLMPDLVDFDISDFDAPASTSILPTHSNSQNQQSSSSNANDTPRVPPSCDDSSDGLEDDMSSVCGSQAMSVSGSDVGGGGSTPVREHGMATMHGFSLTLNMGPRGLRRPLVQVTPDTEDIVTSLRDQYQLATRKYRGKIERWLQILTRNCADGKDIEKIADLKKHIIKQIQQFDKLNLPKRETNLNKECSEVDTSDENDSDFEDVVEKEGYESDFIAPSSPLPPINYSKPRYIDRPTSSESTEELDVLASTSQKTSLIQTVSKPVSYSFNDEVSTSALICTKKRKSEEYKDPTSMESNLYLMNSNRNENDLPSTSGLQAASSMPASLNDSVLQLESRRDKLLKVAPVLPFDLDLHYWGEKPTPAVLHRSDASHRFLKPNEPDEVIIPKGMSESLLTRTIPFSGRFKPVMRTCRAPLEVKGMEGQLCQRMDRVKCPFHGIIIDRDETGKPLDPEVLARLERIKQIQKSKKNKARKTRPKKYPGLTDLGRRANTPKKRLEKKILNKNALQCVANALDTIDDKKKKEKFGHSFISVFKT